MHALGGQRLVDFMGQGRRHLPEGGKLGRLHQTFLGRAQVAGTFLDQALELFAAALAQAGQAQPLADEQQGEHQAQPHRRRSEGCIATVVADLRLAQQVQGPALGFQWQAFPQVFGAASRPLHAGQGAVLVEAAEHLMLQRHQRLLVVLAGSGKFGVVGAAQGLEFAIAPAVLVGDENDPAGIADQQDVGALAPFALKLREFQLDHHGAEKAAVFIHHRAG
ncbi:hypothetical protein D3C77_389010 [compost metagenome]